MKMRHLKKSLWPFQTKFNINDYTKVDEWCRSCIGKRGDDWTSYGVAGKYNLAAFKDEASLLAFKITWSYNGN